MSNNCTAELVGIQITIEFLNELEHSDPKKRCIYFFIDCQPANMTAFGEKKNTTTSMIEIVTKVKEWCCNDIYSKGNTINEHWVLVIKILGATS